VTLLDAINHLLNFFAPALAVAALAASAAKLLWRSELSAVSWYRLAGWGAAASAAATLLGLAFFGRDGRMATYGTMLFANAAALWWAGFGPARR
jgi:hypothetical protein